MKHVIRSIQEAERALIRERGLLGEVFKKPHVLTIEPKKSARSLEQNAYLHGVCYKMVLDSGLREDGFVDADLNEFYCGEFFGWKTLSGLGRPKVKPVRTTTTDIYGKRNVLNKMEFSDFIAFVHQKAAERGIVIPDPE